MGATQTLHNGRQVKFDSVNDKTGRQVSVGDTVDVDDPVAGDMHQHGFRGQVVDVYPERGEVCVIDQDCDCWDVSGENVELAGD